MPTVRFLRRFRHAEGGIAVTTYDAGAVARVSKRCAEVAIASGYAVAAEKTKSYEDKAGAPSGNKAGAAHDRRVAGPPPARALDVSVELRHRGGSWYDLVRTDTGEAINRKALRKRAALDILEG